MGLDSKCFDYCDEIGLMEECYTKQHALDTLKKKVAETYDADPAFIDAVSKLTLNSPEVSTRSCVVYYYESEIDYVINGNIRTTTVKDFGYRHIHEHLKVTKFNENANYKVLKSSYDIPYDVYHKDSLFTYEDMKKALENKLGDYLPSNYSSWRSKSWSVSAYIVPTLVVILKFEGDNYYLYYNLHNGCFHWEWAIDQVIIDKSKKCKNYAKLSRTGALVIGIIAILLGFANNSVPGAGVGLITAIVAYAMMDKAKKKPKDYSAIFEKDKEKNPFACIIPELVVLGFALFAILATFVMH